MKKPTTAAITSFINSRFVLSDEVGPFTPATETSRLMREVMQNFENVFCSVVPDPLMGKACIVQSAKTKRVFAKIRVK